MGKSVVASMEITTARSSHNCRFNKTHRIHMGDARLTIKEADHRCTTASPARAPFWQRARSVYRNWRPR